MSSRLRTFAAKLQGLLGKRDASAEFNDEVQTHLQLLEERFVRQGLSPADAAAAARRQFGNTTLLQEDRREMGTFAHFEGVLRDFRHALRTLWKSRAFAVVAIVTLALGIGASTAIFSLVDNILLEPFPYKDARRLMFLEIHDTQSNQAGERANYTSAELLEFGAANSVFDNTIGASEDLVLYQQGAGTEEMYGAHVTPGTFELFGMPALMGRVMQPADYEPGAPPVFVMRYKAWMTRFNGDPDILNKTFVLNGTPRTLIGIMPPRFGWFEADVMIPEKPVRGENGGFTGYPMRWFLLAHLKQGVSVRQAEASMDVIAHRLAAISPQDYPQHFTTRIKPLGYGVFGQFQTTLYTVLAAVLLLLLIACANVANLMLARATAREKEFALRAVLGAGRARLVRLLLIESVVLAMGGAALGTLLAWGGLKVFVAAIPPDVIPAESVIELNAPVLAFTLCLTALTVLTFGLVPALHAARRDPNDPLRDSGKGVAGAFRGGRFRNAVVVFEVATSLTLLIGAGLLMRSFVALREIHLGLLPDHVFQTYVRLPEDRYATGAQVAGFFRPLLQRIKALPGVVDATQASTVPPAGGRPAEMEISGQSHSEKWQALLQHCSEGYFRVLRIEFKEGRPFNEAEVNSVRKLAVVNETFVRKYFGTKDPIGSRVRLASLETLADPVRDPWFEIVGVVADVRNVDLQETVEPAVWVPYTVTGSGAQALMVRTVQEPASMMEAIRQEIWAADSGVAMAYPGALEDRISERMYAAPRFGFVVMAIFAGVGLLLVTVGVYSILAYATARKTQEIGIRMALGAERSNVLGLVIKAGLRLVLLGVGIGLAVSLALGRVIATHCGVLRLMIRPH
jgi:putative ABC transport system permease protein